jgi:uncharacterized protein YbjT (DUF2867 family)
MTAEISSAPSAPDPLARVTTPILVTGGTGNLGRRVVQLLRAGGSDVRVLSRHGREPSDGVHFVTGDLALGEGVESAVDGTEIVVHCAGGRTGDEDKAAHLVRAAARTGVRHLVYISVVGADRMPIISRLDRAMFGYFASKRSAERAIAESGVPWTTLRATQFYELMFATVEAMARLPVIPVPAGARFQPVETAEVAARLVELALGAPSGLVPDIAGPKIYDLADLVRGYLRLVGLRRLIVRIPLPGAAARALRGGANLAPDRAVGGRTWEDYLTARVKARA